MLTLTTHPPCGQQSIIFLLISDSASAASITDSFLVRMQGKGWRSHVDWEEDRAFVFTNDVYIDWSAQP